MNLIIDIGNSLTKVALIQGETIISKECHEKFSPDNLLTLLEKHKIDRSIVSSVGADTTPLASLLEEKRIKTINFDYRTPIPIHNAYATPHTVGLDRIAVSVAGNQLFPNTPLLIIDIGTCITYDFVSGKNDYLGGAISPGPILRYKSLNSFTHRLPLESMPQEQPELIGKNTSLSIHSGVMNGIFFEITGMIEEYQTKYPQLKTIITGGHTFYFEKCLKNSIFANPNLVIIGLNHILIYNFEK